MAPAAWDERSGFQRDPQDPHGTDEEAQKFLAREKAKRDALKAAKQAAQNGDPATGETAAQDAAQPTQPDCGADTAQMLEAGA